MSVDVIQPSSMLPMKRARETIDLSDDSVSKCGELFVTNCANKWTFYCTYCQKATTDIGVFICHIRLEHLNDQQSLQTATLKSNVSTTIASSLQNELNLARFSNSTSIECSLTSQELATNIEQQPVASYIVKEEPTVNLSQDSVVKGAICTTDSKILDMSNETENAIANENTTATSYASDDLDEEFVALTTVDHETEQQQENKKIIQVVYRNDETITKHEILEKTDNNVDQQKDNNDSATEYIIIASEDESNDYTTPLTGEQGDNAAASGSKRKNPNKKPNRELLPLKCEICNLGFKSRQGLKDHKVIHQDKINFKCPLCPATQYKRYIFINHVLTHESDTCFPCQVCGKIYVSNKERIKHWNSHAKELPFGCNICYRRFRKQQYLTHHLKVHNHYQCHFCPFEFNSPAFQRPPYVCTTCEQLPDIKQKVKHLRSLAEKKHVFDSDED